MEYLVNHSSKQRSNAKLRWQVGIETDIGGSPENQDDCFVWVNKEFNLLVLCVLDGHGREVGKVAAESAKCCMLKFLDDNYLSLIANPTEFLIKAYEVAHEHIRSSFRMEFERQGYEVVKAAPEGYLMKRKPPLSCWSCIHGGTSCSMVAFVGNELYVSNVGDSTGILCSAHGVLTSSMVNHLQDAAVSDDVSRTFKSNRKHFSSASESPTSVSDCLESHSEYSITSNTIIITAEHSAECPYEYERLHRYRPREGHPLLPALSVVYDDSHIHDKSKCPPVFEKNIDGTLCVTNSGSYYKNVRKEWASLVSTPPYARFQDALAFTRSIGDLHLHTYGVTHLPEIQKLDLDIIFNRMLETQLLLLPPTTVHQTSSCIDAQTSEIASNTLCLVLATDGVWDNWLYEDVNKFVMDASCLEAVASNTDGARRVTQSFMQRNSLFAKRNFGSSADNATSIIVYFSRSQQLPSSI